jgi:hypothetical protein
MSNNHITGVFNLSCFSSCLDSQQRRTGLPPRPIDSVPPALNALAGMAMFHLLGLFVAKFMIDIFDVPARVVQQLSHWSDYGTVFVVLSLFYLCNTAVLSNAMQARHLAHVDRLGCCNFVRINFRVTLLKNGQRSPFSRSPDQHVYITAKATKNHGGGGNHEAILLVNDDSPVCLLLSSLLFSPSLDFST